jgi:LysM repeat protein
MRLLIASLLLLCGWTTAHAQTDTVTYLRPTDTLFTYIHPMGEIMFTHHIRPQQTLFSLAKFYGLTIQELYAYNPEVSATYRVGTPVRIPLPHKAIIFQEPPAAMLPGLVPIYYIVPRGETLYNLSKRVFQVPQELLIARNPFLSMGLKPGQLLHIGWMATQAIPSEWHEIRGGPYVRMNHRHKLTYFNRSQGKRIEEQSGAATWPRELGSDGGFSCLHRTAPINSFVEVHNPLTRQTMYLKVMDRLPDEVYGRNTLVVVSPLAAKALGALDDRFYVRLKHY